MMKVSCKTELELSLNKDITNLHTKHVDMDISHDKAKFLLAYLSPDLKTINIIENTKSSQNTNSNS